MKISVIFKPSRKSWIMSDLQYIWYYEIKNIDEVKYTKSKKILIHSSYEKLAIDYEKAKLLENTKEKYKITVELIKPENQGGNKVTVIKVQD